MAPVHDTDIAEERWAKQDWRNFELWEKLEQKARRVRRLWITATFVVFILLSSIPVLVDRWPKWSSLSAVRQLADIINRVETDAAVHHINYRIRFNKEGRLNYVVEKVPNCEGLPTGEKIRTGHLLSKENASGFVMMDKNWGKKLEIPGLTQVYCYDYLKGRRTGTAFAIIPVSDLTESRLDRISVLVFNAQGISVFE